MAKWVADAVIDAALDKIATANIQTVCSQQPANRTEAVTTYALADVTLTPGDGNGDFTVADAAGGGRKVTVTEKTGVTVDTTGTGDHVAVCDGTDLLYVTTCTSQALTASNTMTFGSWSVTIGDPA